MNWNQIWEALAETLQMTLPSTLISYIIGLPLGVLLVITRRGGIRPMPTFNAVAGAIVNFLRSIPFIILLAMLFPVTARGHGPRHRHRLGDLPPDGERLPLRGAHGGGQLQRGGQRHHRSRSVHGLKHLPDRAQGAHPEAMPSLINGFAICMTTILGYTAMASAAGGGGLGALAITRGLNLRQYDVMYAASIVLVILVQIITMLGSYFTRKFRPPHPLTVPGAFPTTIHDPIFKRRSPMKKLFAALLVLALAFTGCAMAETLSVIATPSPHAEVVRHIEEDLAAAGYELELIEVTDYVTENPAVAGGDVMINFFQHIPYLDGYNASVSEEEQLAAVIPTHFEPMGIYPGTKTSLDEIAEGDAIAVPNDPTNMTRAFLLLADAGLISVPEGTTLESVVTPDDITGDLNPNGLEFLRGQRGAHPRPARRRGLRHHQRQQRRPRRPQPQHRRRLRRNRGKPRRPVLRQRLRRQAGERRGGLR